MDQQITKSTPCWHLDIDETYSRACGFFNLTYIVSIYRYKLFILELMDHKLRKNYLGCVKEMFRDQ